MFLCHGWATGLQLGFCTRKLFACSAGDAPGSAKHDAGGGSGSLPWELAAATRVPILAHWTPGHATRNPDLIRFSPGAVGAAGLPGELVARRGSSAYQRAAALLTGTKPSGKLPPVGHTRPAWASLPLRTSLGDVRALLAARREPGAAHCDDR